MAGPVAIGVDIGGTRIRAARVRGSRIEARADGPSSANPRHVIARMLDLIARVRSPEAAGIGIGIPGQVDAEARRALSGGFVDLSGIDIVAEIEAATDLRVAIENDGTMALLAETAFGAAKGVANAVMMTIGTGIGGAILERGRVLRGRYVAGQLGHILVDPNGKPCLCGRTGCVETTSSGTAFSRLLSEAALPPDTRVEDLIACDGRTARRVIDAWARPLQSAIDTLVAVLNPEIVVLGGGAGPAAAAALAVMPVAAGWYSAPILPAAFGDDAGVIGAALAVLGGQTGKRVVLVNGVPASGKSHLAAALVHKTGWPILALDTIKAPFLASLPPGDRAFNRILGQASYSAIFDTIAAAPPGSTFIVDAWFGFQPIATLSAGLAGAGVTQAAELWCHAPPAEIAARYLARVPTRPQGHPGADYVPELISLVGRAQPTGIAPCLSVDTSRPVEIDAIADWIAAIQAEGPTQPVGRGQSAGPRDR